ncbi:uncharacterized protein DS421_12g359550 [Arachis hypogaea]|nr:uncharacterized protein DS421_12g359550 [Arachis hypogaea]
MTPPRIATIVVAERERGRAAFRDRENQRDRRRHHLRRRLGQDEEECERPEKGEEEERMVVGVFLAVTVAVFEAHRCRRERRSLLALLLGVWREWPRSASASGFCKLLESSAAGNQHWSCPKKRLLRYAASALLFIEKGVDPFLVPWNRKACSLRDYSQLLQTMKEKGTQQTKEGDQKLADGGTILIVFI